MGQLPVSSSVSLRERVGRGIRRFARNERGNATIEAAIWTPMLFFLMVFSTNMSMAFFNNAQILSISQEVARNFSLGRYADEIAAAADLETQLAYLGADLTVEATNTGKLAKTRVTVTPSDLMPLNVVTYPYEGFVLDI